MTIKPSFTLGVEEEYLLVDLSTRALINEAPAGFFEDCHRALGHQVTTEFLQCQIEVMTTVCKSAAAVRAELIALRESVITIARQYGLGVVAASTHPFSKPGAQQYTQSDRYEALAKDLKSVARRMQVCGMHVHCGLDDDDLRFDLMNQMQYLLPHLLGLSTSSPFWYGGETGLKSYRLVVWDEMPRTGLPERFSSYNEYQREVQVLVDTSVIEDASKIWWDIRPSSRYQTLEMRVTDVCTRVEDAVCIAALYQCCLHRLYRLKKQNMRWRQYSRLLINENRWRAQRYGIDNGLIDFGAMTIKPYETLIDELLELIVEDAEILNCQQEVQHVKTILANGTSAHRQLATYHQSIENKTQSQALIDVVDALLVDTQFGLFVK